MSQSPAGVQVSVRAMTLDDVEAVVTIDRLSFALPWSERSYRFELTENRGSSSWVAVLPDAHGAPAVAGMIVNWIILDEAHVATIATHPDFRRRGVARRLLAHSLLAAYDRGARSALLEVRRGNLSAQALYFRFGFTVTGERPRYYKDNFEDALLMALQPLDPERLRLLDLAQD